MKIYTVYTDGSFGDTKEVHGGFVYWDTDNGRPTRMIHVISTNKHLTSMRNVGGECLAAISAITDVAAMISKSDNPNEECMVEIVYDYKGVGEWATGGWKTNKPGTIWYKGMVNDILAKHPNLKVEWIWIKGHNGVSGNHYADMVASYDMRYCENNDIPMVNLDYVVNI